MSDDTFRWVIAGGVALAALSMLIMAIVVIVLYRVVSKMQTKADDVIDRVSPLLDSARDLTRENAPKLSAIATRAREIADNAKDISDVAKDQAHRFAEIGRDVADRAKAQVARVDAAVDDTVDQVHNAGNHLKAAALKPVREASGVLAGVKAAVSTYAQGRRTAIDHITQDEEMFI
jgi:F0F1-type ATP synthase membrane subunit b/b'